MEELYGSRSCLDEGLTTPQPPLCTGRKAVPPAVITDGDSKTQLIALLFIRIFKEVEQ
jgi:hypothetical protein